MFVLSGFSCSFLLQYISEIFENYDDLPQKYLLYLVTTDLAYFFVLIGRRKPQYSNLNLKIYRHDVVLVTSITSSEPIFRILCFLIKCWFRIQALSKCFINPSNLKPLDYKIKIIIISLPLIHLGWVKKGKIRASNYEYYIQDRKKGNAIK